MDTKKLAFEIRQHAIKMTHSGNSSHIGSVLSMADILAVLYGEILNIKPTEPNWPERDRFILSKGHAGAGVYAVLAETGFFPKDILKTHYQNGSNLSGHVSHIGVPGVEFSTGSLGHGLSIGAGLSYAAKLDGKDWRSFVLLSDGECNEGSIWEAILFAAHHELNNLVAIVDYNKFQAMGTIKDTMNIEPFIDKWKAFNWSVKSVDGHNHKELLSALNSVPFGKENQPNCIIANTTKGKGVSFMENELLWHYRSPQGDEYEQALRSLKNYE